MQKKLIILGASDLQLPTILKAKEKGIFTYVLDINPQAVGVTYADYFKNISTIDTKSVIEFAKIIKPDGILTAASDRPMKTVAAVCDAFGLPGISKEVAERATNKVVMRLALEKGKVPIPKFSIISSIDEYYTAIANLQGRYIVKPADNSGSRGIYLVEKPEDSEIAYNYSMSNSSNGYILVEEFVEGPEVSVETITYNGETKVIAITDKITTGAPYFVELGHTQPSRLPLKIQKNIRIIAAQAVAAIGIDNSPSHVEIKVTNTGPKIIEIGARMGGDCIVSHLVPLSCGVDMVGASIDLALGEPPNILNIFRKAAAIRYFGSRKGILKSIGGIDVASQIKGIKEIKILKMLEEQLNDIENSTDRLGYVVAQFKTIEGAIDACKKALELIEIIVEEESIK